MSETTPKELDLKIGPYVPIKTLGEGTTGKVKLAVHCETHEKVAIKVISKSNFLKKTDLEAKVQREIALMRLVKHPNIMKLIDVFESPRHLYIVLEYASKGELFDYLVERRHLPEDQAMEFFRQMVFAIEYIHSLGICHRDLKPENILLDENYRIKIADFGFARWVKTNITETACGSPHYAAPEIISGKPYDGRKADIWSLGVILFALVAGYLPFDDTSIRALLRKVRQGIFVMPAFSTNLKDLIQRLLTVDASLRITFEEIKRHPAFLMNIPEGYKMPRPLPFTSSGPIDILRTPKEILDDLERIGFGDRAELEDELTSKENNIAKVFFHMLSHVLDYKLLPWSDSEYESGELISDSQIMAPSHVTVPDSTDPFKRAPRPEGMPSSGPMSVATRAEWNISDTDHGYVLKDTFEARTSTWKAMAGAQASLASSGTRFFHPDPLTLLARKESGSIFTICANPFTEGIKVTVALIDGEPAEFLSLFESIREAISA